MLFAQSLYASKAAIFNGHIKSVGGNTYIDLSPNGAPYARNVVIKGLADYAVIWDDLHIY